LALGAAALSLAGASGLVVWGTKRLRVNTVRLASGEPSWRVVQISDLHYKGDAAYAEHVIRTVNDLAPDAVCFTGDLMEDAHFLSEALELLSGLDAPLFGVPGNHEYWSRAPFAEYERSFAAGGGAWLVNERVTLPERDVTIVGVAEWEQTALGRRGPGRNLLLTHYPAFVDEVAGQHFDLILAGHSHGGQVRLPGMERRFVPYGVGPYDRGHFDTPVGTLYVNAGIGTAIVPFRINCPPEVTLFEL
jgi:predicted MPP superfamily phosphohydrolase